MGFVRKGALILAFAAACAGMTGCKPSAEQKAATLVKLNAINEKHTHQSAQRPAPPAKPTDDKIARLKGHDAADYQIRTERLRKELKAGKATQQEFDQTAKEDDDMIAGARLPFVGTKYLADFDKAFAEDVTKAGFQLPAKMPGSNDAPAAQPSPPPQAQNQPPRSEEILKALAPVIGAMLADDSKAIGPEASDPALGGQTTREKIFPGGPVQNSTRISASALKAGEKYSFNGKLTIDGNLPPNVTINIRDGKLVLNGSAGAGDVINVQQPTELVGAKTVSGGSHPEKYPCNTWGSGPSIDKPGDNTYHYGYFKDGCTKDVPNAPAATGGHEELKYKDTDPAVKITGTSANAKINTNGGKVVIGGTSAAKPAASQPARP